MLEGINLAFSLFLLIVWGSDSVSVSQAQILVRNVCNQITVKCIPDFQFELDNRSLNMSYTVQNL